MTLNGSGMSDFAVCSNNWNFCSNTILYERKTSKTLGPLKFTVPFWNAGFLSCLGDESKESYSLYYIGRIDITGKRDNYFKTYHRFLLLRKGWARLVGKAVKYRFHSSGTEHGSCWSLLPLFQTGLAFLRSLMSLSNIFLPGLLFFTAKLNLAEIKNIAATKERKNREWNGNLVIFNTAIGQTSQGAPTVFSSIKPRG